MSGVGPHVASSLHLSQAKLPEVSHLLTRLSLDRILIPDGSFVDAATIHTPLLPPPTLLLQYSITFFPARCYAPPSPPLAARWVFDRHTLRRVESL